MPENRRHAAIMFTDIVGYTALMGSDEDLAFEVLSKNREIHNQLVAKYNGTLIKEMGDGNLISFNLASDAVYCAIDMQKECKKKDIPLKIGIHEGEMVFEGADVLGDAVNIAARLESDTHEGCIYISDSVYRDIKNRSDINVKYVKEKRFKNVDEPIKVYEVLCEEIGIQSNSNKSSDGKILNRKSLIFIIGFFTVIGASFIVWDFIPHSKVVELEKSIAVLPFDNESSYQENEYFVHGMMDDIRSNLSKINDIRVMPKTSTEKYKNTTLSIKEIGRELGVNYLVEGAVQKVGNQVKIHAQLISVEIDGLIWQDTYERDISDVTKIFTVQGNIAKIIASELNANITTEEKKNIEIIPTRNLTAYDYYLKGVNYMNQSRQLNDCNYAVQMFKNAVQLDSTFTKSWVKLSSVSRRIYWFGYNRSDEQLSNTKYYLHRALELEPENVDVLIEEASYYYQCLLDYNTALAKLEIIMKNYPTNYEPYLWAGYVYRRKGDWDKTIELINKSISINPLFWESWFNAGETYMLMGDYTKAEKYFNRVISLNPSIALPYGYLANIYLLIGNLEKCSQVLQNSDVVVEDMELNIAKCQFRLIKNDFEEAIHTLQLYPFDVYNTNLFYTPKSLLVGLAYYLQGESEQASKQFEISKVFLINKINELGEDPRLYSSLGVCYAGLGLREEAVDAGLKALEILDISKDAYRGLFYELNLAKIFLMTGEYQKSISKLDFLLSQTGLISVELLKIDPFWHPIRERDSFKALINNPEYQVR